MHMLLSQMEKKLLTRNLEGYGGKRSKILSQKLANEEIHEKPQDSNAGVWAENRTRGFPNINEC